MKIGSLFLLSALVPTAIGGACPYAESSSPVHFDLPVSALSHPLKDLPVKFVGLSPVVTRKQVPFGSVPRVTIQRYSSRPSIEYDDTEGMVVISASGCLADGDSAGCMSSPRSVVATLTAAVLAVGGQPILSGIAMAAALAPGAQAFDRLLEECTPSVQVVVEAPAAYMGAVETCLAEVDEASAWQCPSSFPTFPTCADPNPTCKVALVGGGAGGLYAALRMVDSGTVDASDVCVFEMTERVGGRLFSLRGLGPDGDLTVDAGGYRTWPEFTPTLHALITDYLNITMECYDETEDPCLRFNIVDEEGNKSGFATFVEMMMQSLSDRKACFYPYHELTTVAKPGETVAESRNSDGMSTTELHFANGAKATATMTTILNMPQRPLLNVIRNSNLASVDASTLDAMHSVQTVIATKLYLYYPRGQLYWRKLGLLSGDFEMDGDARNMLLAGRFHDGHIRCDDPDDVDTCHGFLLAVYANDLSGNKAQFFRRYQRERPEPVTIMSSSDLESAQFLRHAHSRMEEYILYENANASYTGSQAQAAFRGVSAPEFGVLSTWNVAIPWAGGAWHAWTDLDNVVQAMMPLANENIHVINEAYSLLHGWAEGSVKLADQVLEENFGIARPWDFEVEDLVQFVQQTNSRECVAADDSGVSSGSGNIEEPEEGNPALCFTEDALVEMQDGSLKKIVDIRVGDLVSTGAGVGEGVVTEVLVHPVSDVTHVAVMKTSMGDLVGTPSHPILFEDEWIEMGSAQSDLLSFGHEFVDSFYNLEIDGDTVEGSSHSYVVNGVVASGLGDSVPLNEHFQRQSVWKTQTLIE